MIKTPKTKALRKKLNNSEDCHAGDICTACEAYEKLERKNTALRAQLTAACKYIEEQTGKCPLGVFGVEPQPRPCGECCCSDEDGFVAECWKLYFVSHRS